MNSIFINHATRDTDFALKLAGDLRSGGYQATTFADLEARGGSDSERERQLAGVIASSNYFVPVITSAVQGRSWFKHDITKALKEEAPQGRVMILPVLKEECVLPEPLGVRSPVDFSKSYAEGLHNLIDRLAAPFPDPRPQDPGLDLIKRRVTDALRNYRDKLHKLPPDRFENVVTKIFNELGYEVALTQLVRDGGIDLVAVGGSDASKRRFLIQCKRYAPANRLAVELVKSVRHIHSDPQDGQAHVVTTSSFLAPVSAKPGQVSERLTCSRWEISPVEWNSVKTWIAPFMKVSEQSLRQLLDRHAELVDKKFGSSLSEAEEAELLRLELYLDESESEFYRPIEEKLELALAESVSSVEE